MFFEYNENLFTALIIFILSSYILYQSKNPYMFDENNKFKQFGVNENQTIFPYWLVISIIGLTSYYIIVMKSL